MPEEQVLMDHLFIKVAGSDIPANVMDDLLEVTVSTSLHLPDMFTIYLHDEQLEWVDGDLFALGKEVEISAEPEEGGSSKVLMKGEITAIEPDFEAGTQARLMVRGYDRSHRLHRGSYTETYVQVTDSDLANKVAQKAGLSADVEATSEVYDHVFQNNQTGMEFLTRRANRIGYEVFVQDRTLTFRKPKKEGASLDLEWGSELRQFRPRMSLAEQVDKVIVKGWDYKNRQAIVGEATRIEAEPELGDSKNGATKAKDAFSSATRVITDRGVRTQAEADALAQAILDEISGGYVEAEGECYGKPDLRAGKYVRLTSLGSRFEGTYFVTEATHIYRAEGRYVTEFSILGRRPDNLLSIIEGTVRQPRETDGPVVAVVTNCDDPDGLGRVKVKYPWLSEDVESDWIRVLALGAGPDRGFYLLPEVNDEVIVAFEQGDFNRPLILGGLWNGQDKPPLSVSEVVENGAISKRALITRAGHKLIFTDDSDKGVTLETSGGHKLFLQDEAKKVTVETSGGHKIVLDDNAGSIQIDSSRDLTIKSGANLTIEATAKLELKGATFNLQASGAGEVKSSGTLQMQGALVKIN